jgi:dihydroorotate dehydrogenase
MPLPYPLLRQPLFTLPPEAAHGVAVAALRGALSTRAARESARRHFGMEDPALRTRLWGLDFPNPVGMAAGFDKSARAFNALGALGFGFVEIGTVTRHAQPGNPKPRLFRLPADGALLNRMGFNNPGALDVGARLARTRGREVLLGINIGKSKVTPLDRAVEDYVVSMTHLAAFADYLVVNVSSPNTPGLRALQDAEPLRELLTAVVAENRAHPTGREPRPVLVKLAPDLTDGQLEQAVAIAVETGVGGIIASNTTVSREGLRTPAAEVERMGAGGISGEPLREVSRAMVRRIHALTAGALPVIGVGGIRSAEDAWAMIRAGASLVQVYTGFVYEGPGLARRINRGLLERLRAAGLTSIAQAVGTEGD